MGLFARLFGHHTDANGRSVEDPLPELFTQISHELKNPIASIKVSADILEEGALKQPESAEKFLRNIRRECDRLSMMVQDLLEIARLDAKGIELKYEECDLTELLEDVLDKYLYVASIQQVDLALQIGDDPVLAILDKEKIVNVVYNLVDNAFEFTSEGGQITIGLKDHGNAVGIWVEDTGVGIPDLYRDKIFDRFFTTERPDSTQKGTGLGLVIVKSTVEAHGGRIDVKSEPGKGSRFEAIFPRKAFAIRNP